MTAGRGSGAEARDCAARDGPDYRWRWAAEAAAHQKQTLKEDTENS